MSKDTDDPAAKVAGLAKDIRIAMLTTTDDAGHLVSRPMAQQEVEFDGDLWFLAERDSSTVAHLSARPRVGVTLSDASTWISISGTAELVEDTAKVKELWNTWVEAWMPQGPESGNVALIKVSAESAEYWDTPGRVATLISFAKSKVTGHRYDGGDNQTVRL